MSGCECVWGVKVMVCEEERVVSLSMWQTSSHKSQHCTHEYEGSAACASHSSTPFHKHTKKRVISQPDDNK